MVDPEKQSSVIKVVSVISSCLEVKTYLHISKDTMKIRKHGIFYCLIPVLLILLSTILFVLPIKIERLLRQIYPSKYLFTGSEMSP